MTKTIKTRKKLSELKKGMDGQVVALSHADEKVKHRLNSMGVHKGCHIIRKNSALPVIVDCCGVEIALGRDFAEHIIVETTQKVIFMMGNPNVGKSTIFSRLTGVKTDTSNYPGTTVALLNGEASFHPNTYTVYDMPGVYSLSEENKTEAEACRLIKETPYDIAVYVVDALHLERNLFFAMDIIALGKPVVILLNKYELAKKKGIAIDEKKLSALLGGVPVIAVNGLTGSGLKRMAVVINQINSGKIKYHAAAVPPTPQERWQLIGQISAEAQKITHRHISFLEKLETAASAPLLGIPLAIAVMIISFVFILFTGELVINLLEPLYANYYLPFMEYVFSFAKGTFLWTVLFGGGAGGMEFGVLSEGVKIAVVDVMPYVVIFYTVLEFLSDLGYLPRLAILLDTFLHKVGLHGYSAIPIMLGFGCKVPAIMAVRSLETRRQRIIALALILMLAPCISQTAMMFSILAPHGIGYLFLVFGVMAVVSLLTGGVLNKILPGDTTDIFMEVPSWHLPKIVPMLKKVYRRTKEYVFEAVPLIMLGVLLITLGDMAGIVELITKAMTFPITVLMGLPSDTAPIVIMGFLRKDISIALLTPYNLTAKQLVIACVFMAMYLPCIASFFVLLKEGGWKDTIRVLFITIAVSLLTAFVLNMVL
ncbi:MAG: 50S ribosome-binding GTPase [Elusimicrobiota bacterium]|jgi:ferrous iron transport protein B|nr:50S ribosome-binding GTPase [Elusimicrobiota bacterium]